MITATAPGFEGGVRQIQVIDDEVLHPWFNSSKPLDVNGDTFISPLDALLVINHLNLVGFGRLVLPWDGKFLDTNGDDQVSPLDALRVINYLNLRTSGEAEGDLSSIVSSAVDFNRHASEKTQASDAYFLALAIDSEFSREELSSLPFSSDVRNPTRGRRASPVKL